MPYAFVPPGYRAVPIGQASVIENLGTFTPLEESAVEGALLLARLDFSEAPSEESLNTLEQACYEAGIETWPGSDYYVYAETGTNTVYLVWQKGMPWLPVIIGLLASVALPPLLAAGIWLIMPDSLKSFISGLMNMGMVLLMVWLVMGLMKPLTAPAKDTPKQIEERTNE